MIIKVNMKNEKFNVELELDSARDAARIEEGCKEYLLLERDKVTTNSIFKLAAKLSANLLHDMKSELDG